MIDPVSARAVQQAQEALNLARILWRAGRQDQAIAEASRIAHPSSGGVTESVVDACLLLVFFAIEQQNFTIAGQWLQQAEQSHPGRDDVVEARLLYEARRGNIDGACDLAVSFLEGNGLILGSATLIALVNRLHSTSGDLSPASRHLLKAITKYRPQDLSLQQLVTLTVLSRQQFDIARDAAGHLVALDDQDPQHGLLLGFALIGSQMVEEAVTHFADWVARFPDHQKLYLGYACSLSLAERFQTALDVFDHLLSRYPDYAEAWVDKGLAEAALKKYDLAIISIQRGLDLDPLVPDGRGNLASVLMRCNRLAEAEAIFEQLLETSQGQSFSIWRSLGHIYQNSARHTQGLSAYQQAVALNPDDLSSWGGLVMAADYAPDVPEEMVFDLHCQYAAVLEKLNPVASPVPLRANQPLTRIGIVSGDFNNHACSRFALPLIEWLKHFHVEVTLISTTVQDDTITRAYRDICHNWLDARELSNSDLVDGIRHRQIPFLIDLAGHTAYNRLPVFARQAAPVQMSWLGYPNTTGLKGIGYRMTDIWSDPPGLTEAFYTEKLVRLDRCFVSYQTVADEQLPDAARSYQPENRPVVFGSLNNLAKITPACCHLWAQILKQVPDSKLLIKRDPLGDAMVRARYQAIFTDQGIDPARLDFRPHGDGRDHLKTYQEIDVALDCFPYNGTTTTCEALITGVPVVTLAGGVHRARVGVSLLQAIGRPEWIAADHKSYVNICASIVDDVLSLRQDRVARAKQVLTTNLFDTYDFAVQFWQATTSIWRDACIGEGT